MENFSNSSTNDTDPCAMESPGLYIQIMGSIIFVVVWPFIVLDMKWFPLGRPAAALVGAMLMVLFQVVTQDEVYEVEGMVGNLQTIYLLMGMMILSYYYDREGILRIASLWIIGDNKLFRTILWKICLLSAALSAFITNDAACLVITPLILSEFVKKKRNKKELLPLCLGIATSANIGSAATIFGNPQNAFIASVTGVSLLDFIIAELPSALVGLALSIGLLHLIFFKTLFKNSQVVNQGEPLENDAIIESPQSYQATSISKERENLALSYDQSDHPYVSSQIALERSLTCTTNEGQISSLPEVQSLHSNNVSIAKPTSKELSSQVEEASIKQNTNGSDESLLNTNKLNVDQVNKLHSFKKRSWREKVFFCWLLFISVVVVVLLAVPPPPVVSVVFNLGCIPLGAAISTMLVDTIINRKYAYDAMLKIDWTVILMFMGLFIWIHGFQNTCFPYLAFNALAPYMNLYRIEGVLLFTVFVTIGSNIFSNVPLVILIAQQIDRLCGDEPCEGPLGGLLLAWVSTVAGNFTLIGSIANLIVAEKARSAADFKLTFLGYLRFGIISTLIVIFIPLPIVYYLGVLADRIRQ